MKILVVDDSIVYRSAINQALSEVPGYDVFKTCSNGKIAIDFLKQNPDTDLITLDMEMPVMDGLEAIKEIRKFNTDVKIIVFSAITTRGAEKTIDALSHGADDFVTKIEGKGTIDDSLEMIRDELVPKINALVSENTDSKPATKSISKSSAKSSDGKNIFAEKNIEELVSSLPVKPRMVVIGCSTGGPDALTHIFKQIKSKPSFPILIVQHMPPIFTKKLAEMLNRVTGATVKEAQDGDLVEDGNCYIAPGDFHMTYEKDGTIKLNQDEKVCFVRPAVDVLYKSVSENYNKQILSFILTGMGEDGANGSKFLAEKGAYQYIQDEESSIVWGMPGAVNNMNIGAKIIELDNIGQFIEMTSKRI